MPILGLAPDKYPTHPAHFDIERVIRPNILALHPYRCARDDYSEGILLDANENALGHSIPSSSTLEPELEPTLALDLHRYPSPTQHPPGFSLSLALAVSFRAFQCPKLH